MTTLYPRLPRTAGRDLYGIYRQQLPRDLTRHVAYSHPAQYYVATGGARAAASKLRELRAMICDFAAQQGFPDERFGNVNDFDKNVAEALHRHMDVGPAEAASRPMWAFTALVLLPDVAVWRYPNPPGDRVLDTDITRHVFGRLWWRAELIRDAAATNEYHLFGVFLERNFDQILARRGSIGGSPDLIRALAKEWSSHKGMTHEREVLEDTLKRLMRRGAFQDLVGLPEPLLRSELAEVIQAARRDVAASLVATGP